MEKQKVFIKRYPRKGELPKFKGDLKDVNNYTISVTFLHNDGYETTGVYCFFDKVFKEPTTEFYSEEIIYTPSNEPLWFLEEIELPSEEDIQSRSRVVANGNAIQRKFFTRGANFILNHLKPDDGSIHTNEKGQDG